MIGRGCIIIVFIITSTITYSQTVGLVLSGGGAKGLAHIGVIRALEENDIPIDYIVGTSMGAIIGGLYACGYTPDEMIEELKSDRFINYYRGRMPEEHFYYFKTRHPNAGMFSIGVTMKDSALSVVLPTNLIPTQPMDFGIMEYFSAYTAGANNNFDSLFVPFRCVASDIYNNAEKVFDSGDLGMSIRASMTFPFYFKPVEIDGVLYFDGGIYNNFPQDVMREVFNPDVIIGSVTSSTSRKPDPDDLFLQIENLITGDRREYHVNEDEGFTITNLFKDVGLLDFHMVEELERIGYHSTMHIVGDIMDVVTRVSKLEDVNARRKEFKNRQPELIIDEINVHGVGKRESAYIKSHFSRSYNKLNIRQFESEYYRLISDFQIESARPIAIYNPNTGYFDIDLHVKKSKPLDVMIGANISSGFTNQGFLGVEYRGLGLFSYLLSGNVYFGRLYSSINVGGRIDFTTGLPFAVESSININRWDFFRGNSRLLLLESRPPSLTNYDSNFRVDFIAPIRNFSVIRIGTATSLSSYEYYNINNFAPSDTADLSNFNYATSHFSIVRNNHNFRQYPNRGAKSVISLRHFSGVERNSPGSTTALNSDFETNHSWVQLKMYSDFYTRVRPKLSLGFHFELVASNKPFFRNYVSSLLSAPVFTPFPHTQTIMMENYRANTYLAAGIKPIYLITERLNLRLEAYVFAPYEKILKEERYDRVFTAHRSEIFSYMHFMGTAALVYNTPFGPISISANYYETDNIRMFYQFHFGYILFNKRAYDY